MAPLTPEEVDYINNAEVVIALNKFMAFYDTAGILPTHVWFTDLHRPSPRIIQYIFDLCRKDEISSITFVLSSDENHKLSTGNFPGLFWIYAIFSGRLSAAATWFPPGNFVQRVHIGDWLESETWSASLAEPPFQYRTSFTSALNYISICFPNATLKLVGCDFNSPGYFFQKEMERLNLGWDDWTAEDQRASGAHPAVLPHNGLPPVTEIFPELRHHLSEAGITVHCHNKDSLVTAKGLAEYRPLLCR